jgi:ribose transport system ATP-binding protein
VWSAAAIADSDLLLCATGLRKVYGGTIALASGSLDVAKGEIHALLGENGAGKSTLIKCLAGTPPPDSGEILIAGETLPLRHSPLQASTAGLAFIHQETSLVEEMSVEENVALTNGYPRRLGLIDWRHVRAVARQALESMHVDLDPRTVVAELPQATRTVVAIARALAQDAKVVVLDEPTASLGAADVQALFGVLRRLRDSGKGVVFVSHRLDEVYALCDRITVVRDGVTVATVEPSATSRRELIRLICGHDLVVDKTRSHARGGNRVLEAQDLQGAIVGPITFVIERGEIVGFTGLSDAGHYEIGEMAFGISPHSGGQLRLLGKIFAPVRPADAIAAGVGYIPPDRARFGLARDLTLAENLFFNPSCGSPILALNRFISSRRERSAAREILGRFDVRPPLPEERVSILSGGNAQKVLVARWLHDVPALLVANDVTVGVDVGAREEIYGAIRRAAGGGAAVAVITSDFEEIAALCDRSFVFVRGLPVGELTGDESTLARLTALALGGDIALPEVIHDSLPTADE